jgi:adenylate cyclase
LPKTILAVVDDLMFVSKIRTTASHLGAVVKFARSPDAALAEMRSEMPALVILDLNSPRTDPLAIVSAMKSDPALAAVPTLGFASHLQVEVISAARQGGVDEVLARSAFTAQLAEILSRAL